MTIAAGQVIGSSAGFAPLVHLRGAGNIILSVKKALEGTYVSGGLTFAVELEDDYGEYPAALVGNLSSNMFEGVEMARSSASPLWMAKRGPSPSGTRPPLMVTIPWLAST